MRPTDYGALAERYARHRRIDPEVLARLVDGLSPAHSVLDVGCGTGHYLSEIESAVGCACVGVDPSPEMLRHFRSRGTNAELVVGTAEQLELPSDSFDLVYSVDVAHHVSHLRAAFHEAARVLRRGGRACTVTDSERVIRDRRPLSIYFPETLEVELGRDPSGEVLREEMADAGFGEVREELVESRYRLTDATPFREKVFSSLLQIDDEAFARGLAELEADLEGGPIECTSRYLMLWGSKAG